MLKTIKNHIQKALLIGVSNSDSETLRLQKTSITSIPLIMGPVGLLWSFTYFSLGQNIAAILPLIYSVLSLLSLLHFYITKKFQMMQKTQMLLILIIPFFLMWSLGGFTAGSYVMIWAFFAPIASIIHDKSSKSFYWMQSYIGLLLFSTIIDSWLIENVQNTMSQTATEIFSFLNISITLSSIYLLIKYFIHKNDHNALEVLNNKNNALVNNTAQLFNNLSYLQSYQDNIDRNLIVTKTDLDGKITFANDNFYNISGYSEDEVIGFTHNIIKHPDNKPSLYKQIWNSISHKKTWQGRMKNRTKDGSDYWIDTTISPIFDKDENIVEYIAIRHDITKLMNQQVQLTKMLYTDQLTDLKNRNFLLKELATTKKYSLVLINIDRFSQINDFYGSIFGDKVLVKFSKILQENLVEVQSRSIIRFNGDEFVILYAEKDSQEVISNIRQLIQNINSKPIYIESEEVTLHLSIGISFEENSALISTANMALKIARRESKNLIIYNNSHSLNNEYENNIRWVKKIKDAIADDRIQLFYQPIIDNNDSSIRKYEALIRLIDTDDQVITPFFFLEIAKKAKLYRELTKIVIKKTFDTFENNNYFVSINITIDDILDKGIRSYIYSYIQNTKIASRVTFEIVESENIQNFQEIENFINYVKSFGCKIAIDDFGTGYSNFEHLMRLQADYIKIDGSIIQGILHDKKSELITSVIVAFAKEMDIQTVAEYVENKEINDKLITLGINNSQGYYFGKPEATFD